MSLEQAVNERVSFLKEQIDPNNREIDNMTLQLQIEVLRNADRERLGLMILHKKKQLESCRSIREFDALFTELETLEWLERQVARYI